MYLRHLGRQSRAQVARRSLDDAQVADHVERRLGARAVPLDGDGGKEVLEVDAGRDDERRSQNALERRSSLVVAKRLVRGQENATVKKLALGQRAAPDHDGRIRCMVELGPHLGRIDGPRADVAERLGLRLDLGQQKAAAPLQGVVTACKLDHAPRVRKRVGVRRRHAVDVKVLDRVDRRVVLRADKDGVGRHANAVLGLEQLPDVWIVGKPGKDARIRAALLARAGAAVVRRGERVVDRGRTVANDKNEPSKALVRPNGRERVGEEAGRRHGRKGRLEIRGRSRKERLLNRRDDAPLDVRRKGHEVEAGERHGRKGRQGQCSRRREGRVLPCLGGTGDEASPADLLVDGALGARRIRLHDLAGRLDALGSQDNVGAGGCRPVAEGQAKEAGHAKRLDVLRHARLHVAAE